MMASSSDKLTGLQRELLDAFFEQVEGFYLTGGAALAGFHLGHRTTDDLDLFTLEVSAFESGVYALRETARAIGADLVSRQDAPGFRRFVASRGNEAVVVDLVLERVPQLHGEKLQVGAIVVDGPEEILANKLTAIAGRAEIRDVVDVMLLERSGLSVENELPSALAKDGGATPATIAWVLSQLIVPDERDLPGGVAPAELRDYVAELVRRLRRVAAPNQE